MKHVRGKQRVCQEGVCKCSLMALRMVSGLHVRRGGWSEGCGMRWMLTFSTQEPPQKIRTAGNGWLCCTDTRTICNADPTWSLSFPTKEHQNAPWLKICHWKVWVAQILCVLLPCLSGRFWFFYNIKLSDSSVMAKSWAVFYCSGTYKKLLWRCCGIKGGED